jgi:5'(3')-deoxyribonucleotidase
LTAGSARKLKIAVDLDGVLAETMEAWCKRANELLGTNLKLDDLDTWASWRKLGIDKNQFFQLLDEVWDDWENIPPTEPNLAEKVSRIKPLGSLDVVTGRSRRTVESAKHWLKHYEIPYQRFVRVPGMLDKIYLSYDVYIDDAPELMPLISKNLNMAGILYQRPWNQDVPDMPNISKVESWTQIPRALRQTIGDISAD